MQQFVFYGLIGALNAVFTFAVFTVSLKLLALHYLVALTLEFLLGNLLTYNLNSLFVLQVGERFSLERLFHYIAGNATIFAVNLVALAAIVEQFHIEPLLAQVVLMIPLVLGNFVIVKFWSLRRRTLKGSSERNV